jgi:hypothetical protein
VKRGSKSGVDELLAKTSPKTRSLVQHLRRVVRKSLPEVTELVKWGNPTYVVGGKNVAWILLYKDHVDLGFFQGARMQSKRLEGTGKGLRHVKVYNVEDVDEDEFAALLKQAAVLAQRSSVNK